MAQTRMHIWRVKLSYKCRRSADASWWLQHDRPRTCSRTREAIVSGIQQVGEVLALRCDMVQHGERILNSNRLVVAF